MRREKFFSKVTAMVVAVMLVFGVTGHMVQAAEESNEQIGYATIQTRGVYLQSGYSKISKVGEGKITAGGNTTAQRLVSSISIIVHVERKVNGVWKEYISWTAQDSNAIAITSYKTLTVPKGYSYRVRCAHYAKTDSSSSATGSLYI